MRFQLLTLFLTAVGAGVADAQQIVVQQPVVEQFGVNTTVSVPDRGSALLGGVGSAASGRISTGPFRSGSSVGLNRQASSARLHVYIHDFEAIDAALLNEPTGVAASRIEPRILSRLNRSVLRTRPAPQLGVASDSESRPEITVEAERLARQAEARGKSGVAKLHWQRAARHGSTTAKRMLAENDASAKRR